MKEIVSTITSKGQVTIPAEVRRHLGLGTGEKIAFVIGPDGVQVRPVRFRLESVFGSIEPLPGTTTEDFERQIEEASEEAAERVVAAMRRP